MLTVYFLEVDPKPKSESPLWSSSGTSQKKGGPDSATLIKRTIPYIDTVGVSDELAEAGVGLLILALLLRWHDLRQYSTVVTVMSHTIID